MLQHNGAHAAELKARLKAIDMAWHTYGRFFVDSPRRMAKLVFRAAVAGAGYWAVAVRPYKQHELERIDGRIAKYARVLLKGGAAPVGEDGRHRALSNKAVLAKVGLVRASVEVTIRRLRMLRSFVMRPDYYAQVIACVFGNLEHQAAPRTHDLDGNLLDSANPYAKFFFEALETLHAFDTLAPISEYIGNNFKRLFSPTSAELFDMADFSQLRAAEQTCCIQPPSESPPAVPEEHPQPQGEEEEKVFACTLLLEGGIPCSAAFATYQQLCVHRCLKLGGQHGCTAFLTKLLCTNACPICRKTFSSLLGARAHVARTMQKGFCTRKGATGVYAAVLCGMVAPNCPECNFHMAFLTIDDLLHHQHLFHLQHLRPSKAEHPDIELE